MSLPRPYLWVLMTSIDNKSWVWDLTWLSYALEQPEWLRSLQNTVLENMQLFLPLLYHWIFFILLQSSVVGTGSRNHVSFLSPPVESYHAELPSSTSTPSSLPYSGLGLQVGQAIPQIPHNILHQIYCIVNINMDYLKLFPWEFNLKWQEYCFINWIEGNLVNLEINKTEKS